MNYTYLTVYRIKGYKILFAFLAVVILRIPLFFSKKCSFFKLMGCGKDASVHLAPDFKHWACLTVWNNFEDIENFKQSFVMKYLNFFSLEKAAFTLKCVQSYGCWDGKTPFKFQQEMSPKPVAVLTRATINFSKIRRFKSFTNDANKAMVESKGFVCAIGMGENPINKQATFSIWEDMDAMKNYAYTNPIHHQIIQLTKQERWYKEELFARFEPLQIEGVLNGKTL